MSLNELLEQRLRAQIDEQAARWLDLALALAARGTRMQLLEIYTAASNRLGATPLGSMVGGTPAPDDETFRFDHWTLEDAGRLACLLARHASLASDDEFVDDAEECYNQGDAREQRSWLRGVALLPHPERYLPLVVDACRTNILPLFEAVACDNPYPARYFPERNFNQVVMKSLFNGVALARIMGLSKRANPELARMAHDFSQERTAAGRAVPADIALAAATPLERTDR